MRLSDTLTRATRGAARAARPGPDVLCGPTVYQRIHVGNARPVRARDVAAPLAARARLRRARSSTTSRTSTTRSTRPRRARARSSPREATEWYLEDTGGLGLGLPDVEPRATETIPEISRDDRAAGRRAGSPTRSTATSTSASRASPTTGSCRGQRPGQGRGAGAEPAQGGSARLRALEGEQAGRGHVVGLAVGRGPAGLAHRVLGDGREAPRAGVRDPRRRARPRLPAPRERARAVARARPRVRADLDAQRDAPLRGEKMSKSLGNVVTLRDALDDVGARDAAALLPDRPLAQADRLLGRDAASGGARGPRASATCFRAPSEPAPDGAWERFAAALDDDFNTPEALAVLHEWRDHELLRRGARRSSGSSRSPSCPRRRRRSSRSRDERGAGAGGAATSTRPTGCAARSRRPAGSVRDSDAGFQLVPQVVTRELVYGRRPVREALRGRREVLELWATERALAAEPWLRENGKRVHVKQERELTEAAGTRDHQGVVAWVEPYRYADAYELAAAERPLLVALDQVTDPRNLGAVIRTRRGRGGDRGRRAGARLGAGDARGRARVGRRGRAPAGRGRDEPRALPRRGEGRRPLGRRRGRRRAALDVGGRPLRRARARVRRGGQGAAAARAAHLRRRSSRSRSRGRSSR